MSKSHLHNRMQLVEIAMRGCLGLDFAPLAVRILHHSRGDPHTDHRPQDHLTIFSKLIGLNDQQSQWKSRQSRMEIVALQSRQGVVDSEADRLPFTESSAAKADTDQGISTMSNTTRLLNQ